MTLLTAEQVTNMFLYGAQTAPGDRLDPSLLNHRTSSSENSIFINTAVYMARGAGRFVNSANFSAVAEFFDRDSLGPGTPRTYKEKEYDHE